MNAHVPRVAFLSDSYHEVNGVGLTSRELHAFAFRRRLPFLSIHTGERTRVFREGSVMTCELSASPASVPVDVGLCFDPFFSRHGGRVRKLLEEFKPDLVHITALGHCGIMGAWLAHQLGVPLAAGWHTNLHEFGAWRIAQAARFLPDRPRKALGRFVEDYSLRGVMRFYALARVLFAPNHELVNLLQQHTGKPTFLMQRGVDCRLFSPAKRRREDGVFQLGFVGRLAPEKNVRFLAVIEQALLKAGFRNFRFVIVGQGGERSWLEENLRHAEFTGVLRGEALARAYADFDLFVFPSCSDTFGNVILESLASGVPSVVTNAGGPKFLLQEGITGYVAKDDQHFIERVIDVMSNPPKQVEMRLAARRQAEQISWDAVFERMYGDYDACGWSDSRSGAFQGTLVGRGQGPGAEQPSVQ